MSEEADAAFAALLPKIKEKEDVYEAISLEDPRARGEIGKEILDLIDSAGLSTEYLRYCEQYREGELSESARVRVECMIRIIVARGMTY